MQEATIEVEANSLAAKRLRNKFDRGDKEKKKHKEEKIPSTSISQTYEDKIEEMSKIIKGLSSKLAKMKIDGRNVSKPIQEGGNRNSNQFGRHFNRQ